MTERPTTLPLGALRFGQDYPGGSINARATGREADLDALKASILADGLLQPVLVCPDPAGGGDYFAIAGNRRLAALKALAGEGLIAADIDVPVLLRPRIAPGDALGLSLAENITQAPLHPVDRYEAFAALERAGQSREQIAAHFAVSARIVAQALALGALDRSVRAAWRAGEINAETAQAFTLTDAKSQARELKKLQKQHRNLTSWMVRRELTGANGEAKGLLAFIGLEAYRAAGGALVEDLFGADHQVKDMALLKRLAEDKLQAELARLTGAEGWGWAALSGDLPDAWRRWTRLPAQMKATPAERARLTEISAALRKDDIDAAAEDALLEERGRIEEEARLRGFGPRLRAKAGAVLHVDTDGEVNYTYGLIRPEAAKTKTKTKAGAKTKEAPGKRRAGRTGVGAAAGDMSADDLPADNVPPAEQAPALTNRLMEALSAQLTEGAALALAAEAEVALDALLAALLSGGRSGPLRARLAGMGGGHLVNAAEDDGFAETFAAIRAWDAAAKSRAVGLCAGLALDLRSPTAQDPPLARADGTAALLAALSPVSLAAELDRAFDAVGYFNAAPRAALDRCIAELGRAGDIAKTANKKMRAAFCLENHKGTGWLPPEFRWPGYTGPGADPRDHQPAEEAA